MYALYDSFGVKFNSKFAFSFTGHIYLKYTNRLYGNVVKIRDSESALAFEKYEEVF